MTRYALRDASTRTSTTPTDIATVSVLPAPGRDAVLQRSALPLRVEHLLHEGLAPRALDLWHTFLPGWTWDRWGIL